MHDSPVPLCIGHRSIERLGMALAVHRGMTTKANTSLEEAMSGEDYQAFTTDSGRAVMQSEAKAAFERVQNADHWKGPVNKVLDATIDEVEVISLAIPHFTGTRAYTYIIGTVDKKKMAGRFQIKADGYWAGPCN